MRRDVAELVSTAAHVLLAVPVGPLTTRKIYYHGTPSSKAAKGIHQKGIQPPDLSTRKGALHPVEDRVYITPELQYAIIYAFGGDMAGHDIPASWIKKDPYGYVFIIPGRLLKVVHPDEDGIGRIIYKKKLPWLNRLAEKKLRGRYTDFPEEEDPHWDDARDLYDQVMEGEYVAWAEAGKLLLPFLDDDEELEIISAGAAIAHEGEIKPASCWKIDKRDSPKLKKDGSNFYKVAVKCR